LEIECGEFEPNVGLKKGDLFNWGKKNIRGKNGGWAKRFGVLGSGGK